ncbi:MAG: hypothetical protein GMKNLPBB_02123 [Myxococcota bacterium]|nr:hypothetical protein [Myxococcota bacterium]
MTVQTVLNQIVWSGECLAAGPPPADKKILAKIRKGFGYVPEFAGPMTGLPWLLDTVLLTDPPLTYVSPRRKDLISLVVSQDSSCRYCYGLSRTLLRLTGMPESRLHTVETDFFSSSLPASDRQALDFARKIVRANPRPAADEFDDLLKSGFTRLEITEVAAIACLHVVTNRISTLIAAQPAPLEGLTDHWYSPLLRVFFQFFVNPVIRRPKPPPPSNPAALAGPFERIIQPLDGLHIARVYRQAVDSALASPVLPRRTKLMVWAVIAKTLDCPACIEEPRRLGEDAGLPPELLDEVIERLGGKDLTPMENLLVPLARETVRPQPDQIQRKLAAIRPSLSAAELLEFVGVAALANSISRLSAILRMC